MDVFIISFQDQNFVKMTLVQPSPEMQVLIRQELNEDVNTRDASLQAMKEWLAKQPHLPDTWGKIAFLSFHPSFVTVTPLFSFHLKYSSFNLILQNKQEITFLLFLDLFPFTFYKFKIGKLY